MEPATNAPETQPEEAPNTNPPERHKGGPGPIIGIIIIIILLALGGYYYFTVGVKQIGNPNDGSMIEGDASMSETDMLRAQSSSTELSAIETDLNATDFSGLDSASADFNADLNAP